MPLSPEAKLMLLQQYDPAAAVKFQEQQQNLGAYNRIKEQDPSWQNTNQAYQDSLIQGYKPINPPKSSIDAYADKVKTKELESRQNKAQIIIDSQAKVKAGTATPTDSLTAGYKLKTKSASAKSGDTEWDMDKLNRDVQRAQEKINRLTAGFIKTDSGYFYPESNDKSTSDQPMPSELQSQLEALNLEKERLIKLQNKVQSELDKKKYSRGSTSTANGIELE